MENNTTRYPSATDLHWRESVFGEELMTGGVRGVRGTFEPLSSVTVARQLRCRRRLPPAASRSRAA